MKPNNHRISASYHQNSWTVLALFFRETYQRIYVKHATPNPAENNLLATL